MSADKPFDRALRRLRRDRAAPRFANADYLHRRAAKEIVERLEAVKRSFGDALLLGYAGRELIADFRRAGMRAIFADPGSRFASECGGVQCDEDRLPFADRSFDLIISIGLLDSVNDLPGALILARRALKPDGLFLAAFAGAGSLPRLREAMEAADAAEDTGAAAHIHPQIDVRAAGDLMARAGFQLPVADCDTVTVRYSSMSVLVADLRAMAATNLLPARSRIGRRGLAAAAASFEAQADADGKTGERFEIVHLSGWAPPLPV